MKIVREYDARNMETRVTITIHDLDMIRADFTELDLMCLRDRPNSLSDQTLDLNIIAQAVERNLAKGKREPVTPIPTPTQEA